MPITTENDSAATAILTVRIPRDSDADLVTEAEARLAHIDVVNEVNVNGLRGIEPRLSATAVTVDMTIQSSVAVADLRRCLADSTSVEEIERLNDVED